jgi:hypothetical protein
MLTHCMRSLLLLTLLTAASVPALAQQPPVDDPRADAAKGDYRSAVRQLEKILFAQPELSPADRYELLMLKGECQLQLQDRLGAISAFKSAGKAAGDVQQLAAAQANALVLERSSSGRFTPRYGTTSKEPIDILPVESRKQAMTALQAELWAQYKSQIDTALRAKNLPPIEQVFTRVADMFFLETMVNGDATQTGQVMRDLGRHAFDLMRTELSGAARRVDQLNQTANSTSVLGAGWNTSRLGLTSPQRDELKKMLPFLVKLRDRATEYRRLAARLGGDEAKWDALVADATDTALDCEALSNDR